MSRDLEQLLHDTAVEPVDQVAPLELIGRARRRRRRRHLAAGAGSMVVGALAASVMFGLGLGDQQQPEIVDQPPPTPEPAPRSDDESDDDDGEPHDAGGEVEDADESAAAPTDIGRALLTFGPDGIRKIVDGEEHRIWGSHVQSAFPDLLGGAVLQETVPDDEDSIRWLPQDADAPAPPLASGEVRLHAVVELDGEPTVLFTRRSGEGEDEVETLYAHGLQSGTEQQLGTTGGYESSLGGVGLIGDRLVISRCHLQCQLVVVTAGVAPDAAATDELLPGPMTIEGLDVEHGIAAYVELPAPPGVELEDAGGPMLWLHDVDGGDRRELELSISDTESDLRGMAVEVDLAPDGDAALLTFYRWDDPTEAQTLLVDRLDDQPRQRWLDTEKRVRFDVVDSP